MRPGRAGEREAPSEARAPLSPGVSERHKRKKPPDAARGANEESATAKDGGGTGAAPPANNRDSFLIGLPLTVIRPSPMDGPGRHGTGNIVSMERLSWF